MARFFARFVRPLTVSCAVAVLLAACDDEGGGAARLWFTERSTTYLPDDPRADLRTLEIGDVTGDGVPDLVLGYETAVAVWSRRGTNRFFVDTTVQLPAGPAGAEEIRLVDVDGDQRLDIVLGSRLYGLRLWIQRGTGRFVDETERRLSVASDPDSIDALEAADLDDDGDVGFFLGGPTGARVLLSQGEVYTEPGVRVLPSELERQAATRDALFRDLDGDGDLDLLVDLKGQVELLEQRADGLFRLAPGRFPRLRTARPTRITLLDIDGDGDLDVATANDTVTFGSRYGVLLRNEGEAGFVDQTPQLLPPTAHAGPTFDVLAADVDGDADADLLYASDDASGVQLLVNDGNGRFEDETRSAMPTLGPALRLRSFDIEGDGDLDILAVQPGEGLALLLNQVNTGPPEPTPTPTQGPTPTPTP